MTFRRLLFWLHLATGLTIGLVVAFLAITGSIMAFQAQIIGWAERDARISSPQQRPCVPPSTVLRNATDFEHHAPTGLTLYSDPSRPAEVAFVGGGFVLINGCDGNVIGHGANRLRRFFDGTRDLHRWIALNGVRHETLRHIKNAAVLAFLFLLLSGLVIWFPRKVAWRHLRPAILFRRDLKGRAQEWNWHNVFGFWMSLPLIAIALSGIVMAYPWANALLYRMAGDPPPPERTETAPRRPKPLGVDQFPALDAAIEKAVAQDLRWKVITMRIPAAKDPNVTFTVDESDGSRPQFRGQLVIARTTGEVLRWDQFSQFPRGRRWRMYARFLHTGEAFGVFGRSVALLATLSALMLVWTGFSLSLRRLASWRKRSAAHRNRLTGEKNELPGEKNELPEPVQV